MYAFLVSPRQEHLNAPPTVELRHQYPLQPELFDAVQGGKDAPAARGRHTLEG